MAVLADPAPPSDAAAPPRRPYPPSSTASSSDGGFASWSPRYTSFLVLSDTEDLVTLALDRDTLWLATERYVTHQRAGVWAEPVQIDEGASVFALAPVASAEQPTDEVWAFGFAGGAWHLRDGLWSAMPIDTGADLYSARARAADDVWAAGFDYDTGFGVLAHYDGADLSAITRPWLNRKLLLSIAQDATGELWSGGCDGNDDAFLMRDWGAGIWEPVALPPIDGCIEHLSFSRDGPGLAAAETDILWWDGQSWQALGQPPPEGSFWVRVAASVAAQDGVDVGQAGNPPTGYAIPGTPTWRGYIDGQSPWRFDGTSWTETDVDYRGYDRLFTVGDDNPHAQGFLDLVSNGESTFSVSRSGGPAGLERQAATMAIAGGSSRLSHPLMLTLYADAGGVFGGGADIAVAQSDTGDIWAGASLGASGPPGPAPFLRGSPEAPGGGSAPSRERGLTTSWAVAPGGTFDGTDPFRIRSIDLAADDVGWAFGRVDTRLLGQRETSWRWNGVEWTEMPEPPQPTVGAWSAQLRALPDGRAWALGVDRWLRVFNGEEWVIAPGAPAAGPVRVPRGELELVTLRAPFDVSTAESDTPGAPRLLGWLATSEQLFRYSAAWGEPGPPTAPSATWTATQSVPRGQVLDLQLTGPGSGWAMARDDYADGSRGETPGVLLRLDDGEWTEVDVSDIVRELELGLDSGGAEPGAGIVDAGSLRWLLMAPVAADEVWLHGAVPVTGGEEYRTALVQIRQPERSEAPTARWFLDCEINALDARRSGDGGTDVWIMGRSSCGPVTEPVAPEYAGPISLLRVRDVASTIFLPVAQDGPR